MDSELPVGETESVLESGRGHDGATQQGVTNVKCQCVCVHMHMCHVYMCVHRYMCACTCEHELLATEPGRVSLNNRKMKRTGPYEYLPSAQPHHQAQKELRVGDGVCRRCWQGEKVGSERQAGRA